MSLLKDGNNLINQYMEIIKYGKPLIERYALGNDINYEELTVYREKFNFFCEEFKKLLERYGKDDLFDFLDNYSSTASINFGNDEIYYNFKLGKMLINLFAIEFDDTYFSSNNDYQEDSYYSDLQFNEDLNTIFCDILLQQIKNGNQQIKEDSLLSRLYKPMLSSRLLNEVLKNDLSIEEAITYPELHVKFPYKNMKTSQRYFLVYYYKYLDEFNNIAQNNEKNKNFYTYYLAALKIMANLRNLILPDNKNFPEVDFQAIDKIADEYLENKFSKKHTK